jgi:hypothetical protein
MYDERTISDYLSIRNLSAQYDYFADHGEARQYAELFVEDGEFDIVGHGVYRGRAELAGLIEAGRSNTWSKRVHITADPLLEIDGDNARQRSRVITCVRATDGTSNDFVNTGWFVDELRRTDDGWRFVSRRAEIDLNMHTNFEKLGLHAALPTNA